MPDDHHHHQRLIYRLIFLYFLVCCAIVGGSVLLYFFERESLRNDDTNELLAIAELKTKQIADFRRERFSEANFIHKSKSFIVSVKNYLHNPYLPESKQKVDDWLTTIISNHNYEAVTIMDTAGRIFYAAGHYDSLNAEHTSEALSTLMNNEIRYGDLFLHKDRETIHLEIYVPLTITTSESTENIGVVCFTIDPHKGLFDLMQSWPIQSKTAEVVITRQVGDSILFLNELRHKKNTALKYKLPMNLQGLPVARGLSGKEGIFEGIDYRGQEVLSATKKIPNSNWLVIVKIDSEEVFEPLTEKAVFIFSLMTALLLASGTAFFIVWRGQRMKQLKIEIQSVDAVKQLNRVYKVLSNVNQAIVKIEDRETLLNEICRIAIDDGHFHLCWIGFANEHNGLIEPAAKAGPATAYLDHITVSTDGNSPAGQGPSGTAFRTGKPALFNDMWQAFQMAPWKDNAIKYRLRSSAAFPINDSKGPIGTINFYSDIVNFFTEDEIKLLEELSQDLSYSLQNIEREKEKNETELRYRVLYEQSPDGILLIDIETGKAIEFNEKAHKQLGYTREEFAELKISDYEELEIPEVTAARMKKIMMEGRDDFESQHRTKSGEIRDVLVFVKTLQLGHRKLFYSIFQDITERKQAEKAQRESDALLWEVMDSLPVGVAVNSVNPSVKFNYMNENFTRNYRTTREALTDENAFWEAVYEDPVYREEIKQKVLNDCASGDPKRMYWEEIPITRKEGTYYINAQNLPIPEKNLMISLVWDVTMRKKAEDALRESEGMFRLLFEESTDPILLLDDDGFTDCNLAAVTILGYSSKDEFLNKKPWELSPERQPDGRLSSEKAKEMIATALMQGYNRFEWIHKRSDGTEFPVEVMLTSLIIKGKQSYYTVWRDIAERKKMIAALEESEAKYRLISENSTDVIWIMDLEKLKFTYVSPSVYKLRGFTAAEALRQPFNEVLTPESLTKMNNEMAAFIAEGKTMKTKSIEMDQPHKDGHIVNTEVVITVLPDQTGNPSQILGVSRDITERKKTEEQMMLQSSALEAVANGIVITDPNGIIEWVNPAFSALTGYRLEEAVGRNPRDLVKSGIHDEDYYRNMWITITAGKVWQGELTNRRKDGSFYTEEQTITPIHDIRGRISHFIGVKQDITERKKAAEELIESEANLDVILKSTADGILAVDTNGKIIRTNPQFYDLWQIPESIRKSEDEALLHFVLDQLTDPEAFLAKVKILYQSDNIDTDLLQFKDGRVFERFSAPLLMKKNLLGRVWSFRDITQRKKAEDALRESEEKYKAFFEDDLTGDFISTPDGRLLACNLPFAKIFGYESVDAIMQASAHSLYPDPKVRDMLMKRLTRERRIEYYSSELLRKDGKKVYVIENLIGKFDKKGKLIEFKGYLFDDTNRRNLEHQLIQAQKMESLGTLAGGIAHDFNNILAIILGHNSLIRRKFADNEYIAENAETIAKATQRGAGMVKQLLTFAKKSDVVLESILIQDIINEIRKFIEQTFPKTITIQTKCEKDLPPMVADATQIHQVLLNLCINARDAMPHGGQLSISAVRINALEIQEKVPRAYSPAYIYITVSDSGTGMDEATRIRIFEPFFTTKGRERGTGLGLATVYGIVEAHHGVIEVQSEIGKGSSFHIYFPVQQSFIEHRTAETGSEEIAGGNETILVVDDEESMKTLLSAVFKEKGYTVITASDGQEALDIYRQRHAEINIVLTDMGLPKLGGEEVVSGIKKINKDARIIVASGYFEKAIKTELAKSGVKDFVQKPYLPDEILQKVREVLDLK